ncbi:hypothetical protein CFB82_04390 [Burkholderia sp. HI2714]|uniref:hypothetical protein n=1 Tax=Burkholderia sp. HI2714 TaxID=2015359 RepID=UPI000B7A7D9A|nr:hypothetical protein [Burkholderia sp. HI2714]OXJ39044.1 hypothetical protein CFB82_04390 [Burkholderia sp. HI2714]
MRKGSARTPAALHGELIDHSAFRRLAQEARAAGQRDGGPVRRPGQPAVRGSHAGHPDWKWIAGQVVKRFHSCVKRTIFSVNNTALRRHRRFSATSVSIEIDQIRDENRRTESDTLNPGTAEKHPLLRHKLGNASWQYLNKPTQTSHNSLI